MYPIPEWQERTLLMAGEAALKRLHEAHVLVVGLGGVGAYAAEMICRAGVGTMTIVDGDVVQPGNRNRQLAALVSTTGMKKAEVMAARLLDINPDLKLTVCSDYLRDEPLFGYASRKYDYVVDAIDTLSPKSFLIFHALQAGNRVVSSMGAGGKADPSQIRCTDISKSFQCRLASTLRKRLRRMGIETGFDVIFSTEPVWPESVRPAENEANKLSVAGTLSYLPPLFGCWCASVVIRNVMAQTEAIDSPSAAIEAL